MKTLRFALFLVFFSAPAFATEFDYAVNSEGLTARQTRVLQGALKTVSAQLPAALKRAIGTPIEVKVNPSLQSRGEGNWIRTELLCWDDAGQAPRESQELARIPLFHSRRIEISPVVLNELERGPRAAAKYPCGLESTYQKALAALIHETASIYDDLNLRTPAEARAYDRCSSAMSRQGQKGGPVGMPPGCDEVLQLTRTVSAVPYFKTLAGWVYTGFLFHSRKQTNGHPDPDGDPAERATPAEAFATNMEFFLLDREYACHSYGMYQYFVQRFDGFRPFAQAPCAYETKVALSRNSWRKDPDQFTDLDPSRIYQIQYLHAAKGQDMSSRWGHSMYRLVTCAPEREKVGPECLQDIEYHVVVSYRGNVEDVTLDYLKGLSGVYPSQLFLLPFRQVVLEYTWGEDRAVQGYPLRLTEEQKRLFAYRVLEQYRGYTGKYYFLSNNCATESLNLIKSVVSDPKLQQALPVTPAGLLSLLIQRGIADASVMSDETNARTEGYLYPAIIDDLRKVYAEMTPALARVGQGKLSLEQFMAFAPAQRRALFDAVEKIRGIRSADKRLPAKFYFVENQIEYRLQMQLRKDKMKLFIDLGYDKRPLNADLFDEFDRETASSFAAQNAVLSGVAANKDFLREKVREWLGG